MKTFKSIQEVHPELIVILEEAVRQQPTQEKPWEIELGSHGKAMSLRQRLYTVRKRLLSESYFNSVEINKLEIAVKDTSLCIYIPSWLISVRQALVDKGVELPAPNIPDDSKMPVDEALEIATTEDKPLSKEELSRLFYNGGRADGGE